jgi:hypothetical protein
MTPSTIYLSWLNYLGGFEYFPFISKQQFETDVEEVGETTENILPNWPESWEPNADTVKKQTFRTTRDAITVYSQYITLEQLNALQVIRTSPLVQIVNSRDDRLTVLVDQDSYVKYSERDKLYKLSFRISMTNTNASQRV